MYIGCFHHAIFGSSTSGLKVRSDCMSFLCKITAKSYKVQLEIHTYNHTVITVLISYTYIACSLYYSMQCLNFNEQTQGQT